MRAHSNERDSRLDKARGLAILLVILVHTNYYSTVLNPSGTSNFINSVSQLGIYGVEVFFVLSGYLIESLYGKEKNFNSRSYFLRRIARIYPLWFLFCVFQLPLFFILNLGGIPIAKSLLPQSTIFQDVSVIFLLSILFLLFLNPALWNSIIPGGWSIQSELAHYVLFALFRQLSLKITIVTLCVFNVLAIIAEKVTLATSNIVFDIYRTIDLSTTLSFFYIGVCIHRIYSDKSFLRCNYFLLFVFLVTTAMSPLPFGNSFNAMIIVLMTALFVGFSKSELYWLGAMGRVSYSMYFSHIYILILLNKGVKIIFPRERFEIIYQAPILFLILFTCTLVFGIALGNLSMRYFESYFIKRIRKTTGM
jgi:peptidoglycan/LPS O-acetylase OafA/YrhL